jgi:hypothetical protein
LPGTVSQFSEKAGLRDGFSIGESSNIGASQQSSNKNEPYNPKI